MFRYTVEYHDESNGWKLVSESGIVGATSYGAAADRVVEYFGKENIFSVSLYELEDVLCDEEIRETIDE